jgi:hypothetical protein
MAKGDLSKFWELATIATPTRQATFMKAIIAQHELTIKISKAKSIARTVFLQSSRVSRVRPNVSRALVWSEGGRRRGGSGRIGSGVYGCGLDGAG